MTKSNIPFDMEAALKALRAGQDLTGKDGILTPLIKQLTEAAMKAELEEHLAAEELPNRKNGKTTKTVKTLSGNFELETPRDRSNTFEPQLVKKNQTQLTDELERKIIALFSLEGARGVRLDKWVNQSKLTPCLENHGSIIPALSITSSCVETAARTSFSIRRTVTGSICYCKKGPSGSAIASMLFA